MRFAYPKEDLKDISVTENIENPNGGCVGLRYTIDSLDNPAKNARLIITFNKSLNKDETYSFSFKCVTRIDGFSHINKFFG